MSAKRVSKEYLQKILNDNPFIKIGDAVRLVIREAITNVELLPEERLNTSQIAKKLGVSVTPVRDAFESLCKIGLIVNEKCEPHRNNSYRVFNISNKSISELYAARKMIESFSAFICAGNTWKVNLPKLKKLAMEFQENLLKHNDAEICRKLDRKFHILIVRSTENQYIESIYDSLGTKLDYLAIRAQKYISLDESDTTANSLGSQHVTIYKAIELGFPEQAMSLMNAHIDFCTNLCLKNRK